jgi:hypothetical protein
MDSQIFEALGNKDERPQMGAWAPGNYSGKCIVCGGYFMGDKRALSCAPCAYGDKPTNKGE